MKKIITFLLLFFLIISPVNALENKLYFTEEDGQLYYQSSLIDEKVFLKHLDMMPGDTFRDELIIENGTEEAHELYFKVIPVDNDSNVRDLFDHLTMKIYLDDELIYDGFVRGLDYSNTGVNLQDVVLLGKFEPEDRSVMVVETKLLESYGSTKVYGNSKIDWTFYADYRKDPDPEPEPEDPGDDIVNPDTDIIEILPIPDTGILGDTKNLIPFVILGIVGVLLVIYKKELERK